MGHAQGGKFFLAELTKADHQLSEKTTIISTNLVYFLKHIDDAFQAHLCLLSSHV